MNPLSELRERLVSLAMAGTQLLSEDVRLKKAVESLAPLAEKSPVFQNVFTDAEKLLSAPREEQGLLLLKLLGLLDAVRYTQASGAVQGDFQPLPEQEISMQLTQGRYSEIAPLLEALSTKGPGRMDALYRAAASHPHSFADHRVLDALIHDLTDSYLNMARFIERLLKALGCGESIAVPDPADQSKAITCILPSIDRKQLTALLKRDFDPKGKRSMERRISLIAKIAGQEENDWYLHLMKTGNIGIKSEAIRALRCSEENIPLLLELVQEKTGKVKEAAYQALADLDSPTLIPFWKKELKANPQLSPCLKYTKHSEICDVIAENVKEQMDRYIESDSWESEWADWMPYRFSDKVLEVYQWFYDNQKNYKKLQQIGSVLNKVIARLIYRMRQAMVLSCPGAEYADTHIKIDPSNVTEENFKRITCMLRSLTSEQQEYLNSLCYFICIAADFLSLPASEVYEKWSKDPHNYISQFFQKLLFDEKTYRYWCYIEDCDGQDEQIACCFREPIDPRWFDLFMERGEYSNLHFMTQYAPPQAAQKIGEYYRQKLMTPEKTFEEYWIIICIRMMAKCNYTKFDGILEAQCRMYPDILPQCWVKVFKEYKLYAGEEACNREAQRVIDAYKNQYHDDAAAKELRTMLIRNRCCQRE